jgi:hypothetical protein
MRRRGGRGGRDGVRVWRMFSGGRRVLIGMLKMSLCRRRKGCVVEGRREFVRVLMMYVKLFRNYLRTLDA